MMKAQLLLVVSLLQQCGHFQKASAVLFLHGLMIHIFLKDFEVKLALKIQVDFRSCFFLAEKKKLHCIFTTRATCGCHHCFALYQVNL